MKVYTGTFRHCGDADMEIVVATTVERIKRELIRLMKEYVQWINSGDTDEIPTDFDALQQWVTITNGTMRNCIDLLTDEHILKYAMEII